MTVTPLDVTSTYTLLQSTITPRNLVKMARERGYSAIALTDKNVLYGAVDFYNAANQENIRPIIGLKLQLTFDELDDREIVVTLLAKNQQGYAELMQLSTRRMNAKSNLNVSDLSGKITNCAVIVKPTMAILTAQRDPVIQKLLAKFAQQPVEAFLGINLSLNPVEQQVMKDLSDKFDLKLIADETIDYLDRNQYFPTQVLKAIRDGRQIESPLTAAHTTGNHYLKDAVELTAAYQRAGLTDAVKNNEQLVQDSSFKIHFQQPVLPAFPVPSNLTTENYLRQLCIAGLKKRRLAPNTTLHEYRERLDHELAVIHRMGFDNYFLIVWDIMAFAHRTQITTGPGRGSAAGSLVAYALAITDVDPLEYGLLFERFLNPERAQMPDIDLDIPDNRRQEVLAYVHHRYGHERVAQIITFGTLAARQVVRDVGRVFGAPKYQVEQIIDTLRVLDRNRSIKLVEAVQQSRPLRNLMADNSISKLIMDVAQKLEGLPRHYSTHAAGVVLSATPLDKIVPLQPGNDEAGMMMTQFPKEIVETIGLLKMDFLGLRNLSIMDRALSLIHQSQSNFDITKVPLNDPQTINLFKKGLTDGIFQFESSGIRQTLRQLSPDCFEDIVAVNALYRPGPIQNIPHFIARKHGQEAVQLPDPSLQRILGPTYGILVYQEQVMQVASQMAGFSLGQADLLRRAMSKKKQQTMESMRSRFISGAVRNGYSQQIAKQVFNYIDQFANYGFNRSHAVAYSKMAFEMAYLKCHYSVEFFTALLAIEPNMDKLRHHYVDAKRFGVKVSGPDINQSDGEYSLQNHHILMGFSMIKGMRRDFVQAIILERKKGRYTSLPDFVQRLGEKWQKQSLIEPLIYVGAFDHLGYNRAEMIDGLAGLFAGNEFNFQSADLQPIMKRRQEYPLTYRLQKEHEYLGIYLSGHPVIQYQAVRQQQHTQLVADLRPSKSVKLIVMINQIRQINTKRTHQPMAFVTASDETGSVDVTIFPRQYQRFVNQLQLSAIVMIEGSVENRNDQLQVIANQIVPVVNLTMHQQNSNQQRWVIRIVPGQSAEQLIQQMGEQTKDLRGTIPVVIYDVQSQKATLLPRQQWLSQQDQVRDTLNNIFGSSNVVLQTSKK
ncbi:DNA polymerase III subunit alpha [uncultured Limosilactobacillus sp.]|uniref:DNA polymerase III subunit alpha n=1 Tax=uncultured Limosilactobacillus sp. TaxID=2837629 RepID=UPI0025CE59E9|nr:DNA polymerase III subunit alpha [uncultured Limosilactobacillus sp.]